MKELSPKKIGPGAFALCMQKPSERRSYLPKVIAEYLGQNNPRHTGCNNCTALFKCEYNDNGNAGPITAQDCSHAYCKNAPPCRLCEKMCTESVVVSYDL